MVARTEPRDQYAGASGRGCPQYLERPLEPPALGGDGDQDGVSGAIPGHDVACDGRGPGRARTPSAANRHEASNAIAGLGEIIHDERHAIGLFRLRGSHALSPVG